MSTVLPNVATALRRAVVRGAQAPSIHNSQPWRFVLSADALELHSDETRRLSVLDPRGRQMLISCGCALLNARTSLARSGLGTTVRRLPDARRPHLLARITVDPSQSPDNDLAALEPAIDARHTDRVDFDDEPVPEDLLDEMLSAAVAEGARAIPITRASDRDLIARLTQRADRIEHADPAYRAELRAWGWLPTRSAADLGSDCVLLVGSQGDDSAEWLHAGEAVERMLLIATRRGYAARPMTQVIEVADTNADLREGMRLTMHPHVLLQIGHAPTTPEMRRRRLVDMLTEV